MTGTDWELPALPSTVATLRRHAGAFAVANGASDEVRQAVALAVSETVTNVVVHAYARTEPGTVSMRCWADGARINVEVADRGGGVTARSDSPGMGHGLAFVGAMAHALQIRPRRDGPGTVVTMSFATGDTREPETHGLEPLCALAIETIADASCLDLASGGVLRRATAEVAGNPEATEWLRAAVPPARPGTATWAAMREGGAHLVVHDPAVPRSPGGTGERLGLTWWLSVPLDGPDGQPAALWGLGGRAGGQPIPSGEVVRDLARASRTDLSKEDRRDELRAALSPFMKRDRPRS